MSTKATAVDMKLEVVVIPVSDVDRANAVLRESRVEAGRHSTGLRHRPVHAARLRMLGPVRRRTARRPRRGPLRACG